MIEKSLRHHDGNISACGRLAGPQPRRALPAAREVRDRRVSLRRRFFLYLAAAHLFFAAIAVRIYWRASRSLLVSEVLFVLSFIVGIALVRRSSGRSTWCRPEPVAPRERLQVAVPRGRTAEMDQLVAVTTAWSTTCGTSGSGCEEQHHFIDRILAASPSGVLLLDFDGRIATSTRRPSASCARAARASSAAVSTRRPGRTRAASPRSTSGASQVVALGGGRRAKCQRSEFMDRGFARPFFMMEELTEELRRSEKAAYEKLIRMMSHEVNNSVGAATSLLDSCLNYEDQIRPEHREDFERALGVVIGRTRELNVFMQGFADVVRLPAPRLRDVDLRGLLEDVGALLTRSSSGGASRGGSRTGGAGRGVLRWTAARWSRRSSTSSRTRWRRSARTARSPVTPDPGRREGRRASVRRGHGAPLTAEVQAHLFTPFYTTRTARGSASRSSRRSSTGTDSSSPSRAGRAAPRSSRSCSDGARDRGAGRAHSSAR